jgi:hypothetical protein
VYIQKRAGRFQDFNFKIAANSMMGGGSRSSSQSREPKE